MKYKTLSPFIHGSIAATLILSFSCQADESSGKYTKNKVFQLLHAQTENSRNANTDPKDKYFAINLNPFVVSDYEERWRQSTHSSIQHHLHEGGIHLLAEEISKDYNIKISYISSWAGLTLYTFTDINKAKLIYHHKAVSSIEEIDPKNWLHIEATQTKNQQLSLFNLSSTSGEVTSWAKNAVNTNDNLSSNNSLYLIDGNVLDHSSIAYDVNIVSKYDPTNSAYGRYHVYHIAGLVGGRRNNMGVIGINPNQPLKTFGINGQNSFINLDSPGSAIHAFNVALMHSEYNNEFSVLNISANYPNHDNTPPSLQPLAFNQHMGVKFRIASNRFLVTNSSGNMRETERSHTRANSCARAYHYQGAPRNNDGIIVVGGIDEHGAVAVDDAQIESSTFGPCIEAWGPAKNIISFDENGDIVSRTGTSFAAPVAAAIASRFGGSQTRPIEREAYIINNLQYTGHHDPQGRPVRKVFYTPPWQQQIPKKISSQIIYASGPNPQNAHFMTDSKFLSPNYWNANAHQGTVVFDLGSQKTVTGIRITLRSSAAYQTQNPVTFNVQSSSYCQNHPDITEWYGLASHTEQYQADLAPVYMPVNLHGRYFKLSGFNQASWLAYAEVEFYAH